MKLYSLDNIVRETLATREYPLHWYLSFMVHAIKCVREMNMDVMQNVSSVRLPVNSYGAVTLPGDYVDYIRVGIEKGPYLQPLQPKETYNRLNNFDSSGNKIPYDDATVYNNSLPFDRELFWYSNAFNDKGEFRGRVFNNTPAYRNSFIVVRERCEIQLDPNIDVDEITMDYITDGLSCGADTCVHPYSAMSIEAFIIWQMKDHSRAYNRQEAELAKQEYVRQYDILQGRMNPIDTNDIIRSLRRGYSATIKN